MAKVRKSVGGRANKTSFKKGMTKTGGRKKGSVNKITSMTVENRNCIMMVPEILGSNGTITKDGKLRRGTDGALGFWLRAAVQNRKTFLLIAARQIPVEVNATVRGAMTVIAAHVSEKEAAEAYNSMLEDQAPRPQLERAKDGTYAVA